MNEPSKEYPESTVNFAPDTENVGSTKNFAPEQKESEAVCKKCGHKEKYHNDEMGCLVPLNVAFICDCTKFVPEQKESSKTGWRERIVEIYARRQKAHDELLACDIALDKLFKETHEN